jgi:tRNA(adenine34) deaminase
MCAGAILQARLKRIVFGAFDPKGGAVVTLYRVLQDERLNHSVEITGGVQKERCGKILSRFFREKRVIATIDPGQDY